MLFRWLVLLFALPFVAAFPVKRAELDLGSLLAPILRIVTGGFSTLNTLIRTDAYITPATAGGKRIKVTGGRSIGFDAFIGIPFAEPVTGAKRFDRPSPKVYTGDFEARRFGPACMQVGGPLDSGSERSEDCLYLDVMTPNRVAGTDAKLPVMVWIYGGGFYGGSSPLYTSLGGPAFVKRAKNRGKPVIFVAINYRLGVWGFPTGKAFADNGSLNNGLRDQQLALQWIQENIAAFGGDPAKVTIFGESAGAISAAVHLLNEGDTTFRGAIMQSGTPNTMPLPTAAWEEPYNDLAQAAGCAGNDTVNCLKNVPAEDLLKASAAVYALPRYKHEGATGFVFRPTIDGDLIKDFPSKLMAEGKFARKPFINGQNKDEATLFVDPDIDSETDLEPTLQAIFPNRLSEEVWQRGLAQYPNDPSLGAPFDTGTRTFGKSPFFKQGAALGTDALFTARRRDMMRKVNQAGWSRTWTYHFEGPVPILPDFLGIPHAVEITYMFGIVQPLLLFWGFHDKTMSNNMMDYWTNFATNLDPNGDGLPGWNPHNFPANKDMLRLKPGSVGMMQDDFREERAGVFNEPAMITAMQV